MHPFSPLKASFASLLLFFSWSPFSATASTSLKVVTEDFCEEDKKGSYRYTTIEEFLDESHHLTERLYWSNTGAHEHWRLSAKAWEDENGDTFMCLVFTYDDEGHLLEETLYGNLSGNGPAPLILDARGVPLNPDAESFTKARTDRHDHEAATVIIVDPDTGEMRDPRHTTEKSFWRTVADAMHAIANTLQSIKHKISYTDHMQEEWDKITHNSFNKGFLQLSGYYRHPADCGRTPYGEEINGKIRITMINGILNIREDMEQLLKLFSETHGNVPIHYVFRPTEGWTKDLLFSTLSKMGYVSTYALLLAEKWKELIEEMGGVGQGGKILHYAHSIGATDTYVAKDLMTPEELAMIDVITLGSPSLIPDNAGFCSSINYISKRDGVCLLDPLGYVDGWINEDSNTEFLGSFWGIPFVDHTLYTDTYGKIIYQLGARFVEDMAQ